MAWPPADDVTDNEDFININEQFQFSIILTVLSVLRELLPVRRDRQQKVQRDANR